jgi:hypothetical protein
MRRSSHETPPTRPTVPTRPFPGAPLQPPSVGGLGIDGRVAASAVTPEVEPFGDDGTRCGVVDFEEEWVCMCVATTAATPLRAGGPDARRGFR